MPRLESSYIDTSGQHTAPAAAASCMAVQPSPCYWRAAKYCLAASSLLAAKLQSGSVGASRFCKGKRGNQGPVERELKNG